MDRVVFSYPVPSRWLRSSSFKVTMTGVFAEASEFRRVIVRIAEDWMKERFACALHNDGLAGRPGNIHHVR